MEYVSSARTILYGYVLLILGYREAQGASTVPVQGLRYDMYARIIHTYQGHTDLD